MINYVSYIIKELRFSNWGCMGVVPAFGLKYGEIGDPWLKGCSMLK